MTTTKRCAGPCGRDLPLNAYWVQRKPDGRTIPRARCPRCLMADARQPHRHAVHLACQRRKRRERNAALGLVATPRRWWTTIRASIELGCSRSQVYVLIGRGNLRAFRNVDDRQWRIDPASVAALLAAQEPA